MATLQQQSIDDLLAHSRKGDPETSVIAAQTVDAEGKRAFTMRALFALRKSNPTAVEAWKVTSRAVAIHKRENPKDRPLGESTIRSRLPELVRLGLVEVFDRKGSSERGGACSRYRLTAEGVGVARSLEKEAGR